MLLPAADLAVSTEVWLVILTEASSPRSYGLAKALFAAKKDGMALLDGRRLLDDPSRVCEGPADGARITNASI